MYKQLIIDTAKEYGILRNQLAYILATVHWETNGTFKPVKEAYYLGEPKAENYRKKLRYYPWYGRGFVQLTWEENYIKAGKILNLDLTTNPDRVMEPTISAIILIIGSRDGWFTGKKLSDFITLKKSDFFNARVIINGDKNKIHGKTDKNPGDKIGTIIADLAKMYDKELLSSGYGVETTAKPVQPAKPVPQTSVPESMPIPSKANPMLIGLGTVGVITIGVALKLFNII